MLWTDRLPGVFQWLAGIGLDVEDSEDARLDKGMLTLVSSLIAGMSFAWIAIYLAIGLPWSAAIPFVVQRAVDVVWPHLAGGCHTSRDSVTAIVDGGFEITACRRFSFKPCAFDFAVAPHVIGTAMLPAA